MPPDSGAPLRDVTELLAAWSADPAARNALMPLMFGELRALARRHMRRERPNHTLQATALVNEVYLKLAGVDHIDWKDRTHFVATVATMMRRILVDHARARDRDKRGGRMSITSLEHHDPATPAADIDLLALEEALNRLSGLDSQQARIVELRFFGGLSVEETAEALAISPRTVKREWAHAKAWLHHELASLS